MKLKFRVLLASYLATFPLIQTGIELAQLFLTHSALAEQSRVRWNSSEWSGIR
jgi:hypothetical protein